MKRLSLLIIFVCSLSSCSLPALYNGALNNEQQSKSSSQIYTMRIERWDRLLFSGILGLKLQTNGFYYVVLDATGISLLEAQVFEDGSFKVLSGQPKVKESGLPSFLCKALARMYTIQLSELPCSTNGLTSVCKSGKVTQAIQEKTFKARVGLIPLWRVDEKISLNGEKNSTEYYEPWLGLKVVSAQK